MLKDIILLITIACSYTIIAIIGATIEISIIQGGLTTFIVVAILSYLVTQRVYHIFTQYFLFYTFFICIASLATLDEVNYGFWQDITTNFLSLESLIYYISPTSSILPIFLGILIGGFLKIYLLKNPTQASQLNTNVKN